jgi:hypothetical protein
VSGNNVCGICGATFRPRVGHCTGGRFGGCCRSFTNAADADAHRVGNHDDGTRRCMTDSELHMSGYTDEGGRMWSGPRAARNRARFAERSR